MGQIHRPSGGNLLLELLIQDGNAALFPRAFVYDSAGAQITGSPFALTHLANGLYRATTGVVADGYYTAVYIPYSDAGFTVLAPYKRATDTFEVDARIAQVSRLHTDYTTVRATNLDRLDVNVSTRSTLTDVQAAAAVWNALRATYNAAGSFGETVRLNNTGIADNTISATKIASAAITSAKFATDAITAAALAASASAEIADAVWDEARAGHVTVGSFGEALQGIISTTRANNLDNLDATISSRASQVSVNALPTVTQIADAVWDEPKAGHVAAGTFGESNQGIVSVARANNLDNLDATISSRATQASLDALNNLSIADVQTALTNQGYTVARASRLDNLDVAVSTRSTLTAAQAADQVWDEPRGGHIASGTFGEALQGVLSTTRAANLDNLDVAISTRSSQTSVNTIDSKVDTIVSATQVALPNQIAALNDLSSSQVAAAVWNALTAGYNVAGSFGEFIQNFSVPTVEQIADAVWDEPIVGHTTVGTTGKQLADAGAAAATPAEIADAVWDEAIADHLTAGSTGASLNSHTATDPKIDAILTAVNQINTETDPSAIANAVWNQARASNTIAGSFGEALQGVLSTSRAALIDNLSLLDVAVSTRASGTVAGAISADTTELLNRLTTTRASKLDFLDATISSRATQATVAALPNLTQIVNGVLDEPIAGHLTAGTVGKAINDGVFTGPTASAIADAVWDEATAGHNIVGTFGARLDVAISSRASDADMQAIKGAGFNGGTDSLESIRDSISGIVAGGDATLAKQNDILAALATKASQTSVNNLQVSVNAIPTNPLLTTDIRLNNLDQPVSSRLSASAFDVIKGAGFNASTDTLEAIRDAVDAGLDLSPVLTELTQIKGAGFASGTDSLSALEPKILAAQTAAQAAETAASNAESAVATKASQASVDALQVSVNARPTNPLLTTDPRLNNLNAPIANVVTQTQFNEIKGATFNAATDSLEAISNKVDAIDAGDATLAKQNQIIALFGGLALETTLQTARSEIAAIPTNPLLTVDARLNNLDATISSRATDNDMQLIKGSGFASVDDSLAAIKDAISAANLDLSPVLSELTIIKGSGFLGTSDSLKALNDIAKVERSQIKSDTSAILAVGEPF